MKHPSSKALYDYWLSRRHDVEVRASGIHAAELAPLLPDLFLVELDPSERPAFGFRYCGAAIARRYGRDLTDEDFLALWSPPDRSAWQRDLRAAAFRSTGMVTGVLAETMGGGVISYEMLVLPLAGDLSAAGAIGTMARIGGHENQTESAPGSSLSRSAPSASFRLWNWTRRRRVVRARAGWRRTTSRRVDAFAAKN